MTLGLADYLSRFNRKERFFLVGWCLDNPRFTLGARFRRSIRSVIGVSVPRQAFAAMDYHLDWLYASIFLAHGGDPQGVNGNGDHLISGNQEDIDWLVAFRAEGMWQVVMIEVKGVTGWSNKQALSKANRLRRIFGAKGNRWPGVRPHFVIASPTRPAKLDCRAWPSWMKRKDGRPDWVNMDIPPGLIRPTRCDQQGRVAAQGEHWKVVERSPRAGSGGG